MHLTHKSNIPESYLQFVRQMYSVLKQQKLTL